MEIVLNPTSALGMQSVPTSHWVGRVLTGLVVAFMLIDSLGKLLVLAPVIEATRRLGYGVELVRPIGVLLGACTLLHAIPRTQFLGALLLTAYLGGAAATHVRSGTSFWFTVAMGAIVWLGYYLRSPGLRALILSTRDR